MTIAEKHHFEYILLDVAASSPLINKVFVLSSDYILQPVFSDADGIKAVQDFLTRDMPEWIHWQETIIRNEEMLFQHIDKYKDCDLASYQLYRFKGELPNILPFIVTKYELDENDELDTLDALCMFHMTRIVMGEKVEPKIRDLYIPNADGKMVVPFCTDLCSATYFRRLVPLLTHRCFKPKPNIEYVSECFRSLAKYIIALNNPAGKTRDSKKSWFRAV